MSSHQSSSSSAAHGPPPRSSSYHLQQIQSPSGHSMSGSVIPGSAVAASGAVGSPSGGSAGSEGRGGPSSSRPNPLETSHLNPNDRRSPRSSRLDSTSSRASSVTTKTTASGSKKQIKKYKSSLKNPNKNLNSDDMKVRLHHLFDQIEKEFDLLMAENAVLKERVDTLEEVIISSTTESPKDGSKGLQGASGSKIGSQLKRDSMVAASNISQKIKSTYRLKTSGKIFNKIQHPSVTSALINKYELHKDGVWHITCANRFNRLLVATASADGTASITDMTHAAGNASTHPIITYVGHSGCSVNCIKFHPKYDLMVTASGDSGAHIWKPNFEQIFSRRGSEGVEEKESPDELGHIIKQARVELTGHTNVVIACDWMASSDRVVTASWDRTANLYDLQTGEMVVQLVGHDQELTDVSAHPSAPLVVTSSHDTTFRLWDFRESIHSVCVFQGHSERVNSATFFGPDKVVSGSDDRTVKVWDIKNMRSPLVNIHFEAGINRVGIDQSNHLIGIPLENRTVRIYDGNGSRVCRLSRNHHDRMVTCVAFAPSSISTPGSAVGSGASSSLPTSDSTFLNNIQLFTCAFDRKVCWWNLSPEREKS